MPEGLIVKALSGYYYVRPDDGGEQVQCRARGIFRKKGDSPLVGDRVRFTPTENGEGSVDELLPRTSELVRPPVANIDVALLVFAVAEPELSRLLLDKFLVHVEQAGLRPLICLTKGDLLAKPEYERQSEEIAALRRDYERAGYTVLLCSAKTGDGAEALLEQLAGRTTVCSGQSGVGKSSLLNRLIPGLRLETNEISSRLGRGKHTTRHVELVAHPQGGYIADTPGFSQLDFDAIEAEQLTSCFIDLAAFAGGCKFRGCLHRSEPGCAVREAVADGRIARTRYEHYVLFVEEIKDRKRRF